MDSKQKSIKVIVSLWMAGSAGRRHLQGILRYANARTTWSLQIVNDTSELSPDTLDTGVGGFIGEAPPAIVARLRELRIPSVIFGTRESGGTGPCETWMCDDNGQIGRMAVEHFLSLGNFASFAFLPDRNDSPWSSAREMGFRDGLAARGRRKLSHLSPGGDIERWIRSLPKPTAVFVACDFRARELIDVCLRAKIAIPRQVAVLGVDNDELVCDYVKPTLSSIRIDHEDFGHQAAEHLAKLMRGVGRRRTTVSVCHPAAGIVERESTNPLPPITDVVRRMTTFIREHAREAITVADVAEAVRVSRRLADLRLKAATGKTVHETLRDVRLDLAVRYLRQTKMPIQNLSRLSGYPNVQRLKYVFKARYGVSMSAYRAMRTGAADCSAV